MVVSSCARSAVDVSVLAEASSSVEADDTVSTISPTAPSKSSASLIMVALRSAAVRFSVAAMPALRRSTSIAFVLNPSTVPAISPISSPRLTPGITTSKSPAAILPMASFNRVIGRARPRKPNATEPSKDSTTTIDNPKFTWLASSASFADSAFESSTDLRAAVIANCILSAARLAVGWVESWKCALLLPRFSPPRRSKSEGSLRLQR